MHEYDANIICSLDCDKFRFSEKNKPKKFIEIIPIDIIYSMR